MSFTSYINIYRHNKVIKKLKQVGTGFKIFGQPDFINPSGISIGDNFNINDKAILNATGSEINIGNGVTISSGAMVLAASYDVDRFMSGENGSKSHKYGKVNIGDRVWICAGAIILPNVTIPDHVVIAAGSIVAKDVPESWCIVAGNPARVVKKIEIEK